MNRIRTVLLCYLICIKSTLLLRSDWVVPIEFLISGKIFFLTILLSFLGDEFRPFGKIVISATNDHLFKTNEVEISKQLFESFKIALTNNLTYPTYRIRAGDVESSTFPVL